jgi:hypothetical protein
MTNGDRAALSIGVLFGILILSWFGLPALKEARK